MAQIPGTNLDDLVHRVPKAEVKLSEDGKLSQCSTGAVRSTDALAYRYDLISPIGLRRVAEASAEGAVKYAPHNWELGFPIGDLLNHAIRHVYLYLSGDRSEDHLGHSAWGLFAAMHSEEMWPHLNEDLRGPDCTLTDRQRELIKEFNDARVAVAAKPRHECDSF